MNIALLHCDPMPEPDPDQAPLLAALRAAGHEAEPVAWNTSRPESLSPFDAALLRATWDYYRDLPRFLDWIGAAAGHTTLLNPLEVVRANAHKGYLLALAEAGVATVPTVIVPRGATGKGALVESIARGRGLAEIVIKPAIGAASFLTLRTSAANPEAQAHLDEVLSTRDAMVQPFVRTVGTVGERSVVCFRGVASHAVHKRPRFKGEEESVTRTELTEELKALAQRALEAAGASGLLYARVDCFEGEDGSPMLSELELIEPSLYFGLAPGSAAAFVTHLEHHLELSSAE